MAPPEAAKKQEEKPAEAKPQQLVLEEDDEFEEFSTEGAPTLPAPSTPTYGSSVNDMEPCLHPAQQHRVALVHT